MTAVNKKAKKDTYKDAAHKNFMAGLSYKIDDPIMNLRIAASTCFFGEPSYYQGEDATSKKMIKFVCGDEFYDELCKELDAGQPAEWRGKGPADLMELAIDNALNHDPEATLKEAVRLRVEEHIRTTPQIILVRAACHPKVKGTELIRRYASDIIQRADEPSTQLAYYLAKFCKDKKAKKIPNSLKKIWKTFLEKCPEYVLAKYRMENRDVKTVDVVNLVHPKSSAISKLMKGELTTTDQTWESIISAAKPTEKKEAWIKAIDVMGHMALLRNIRNMIEAKVPHDLYLPKLIATAKTGKQLPFRYYSAYNSVADKTCAPVMDAIEECLEISFENTPKFNGRVMSLCDNSGSAQGTTTSNMGTMPVCSIANLTGIITGKSSDEGYIGLFGDELETFAVTKKSSTFDLMKKCDNIRRNIGQSTENGIWLFWDKAIKEKQHWDHVFIYSDMQAGHGGLYGIDDTEYSEYMWHGTRNIDVPKLINKYRRVVNPNVFVYLVQVAGYQDTIVPQFFKRTYVLGGWGEGILRFASEMTKVYKQ